MRALIRRWAPRGIRGKLIMVYLLVGFIPFSVFMLYAYRVNRDLTARNARMAFENAVEQAVAAADNALDTFDAMSAYVFNDTSLLAALNRDYGSNYYSMYHVYRTLIEPNCMAYYALYPALSRMTVYTAGNLHPYSNYVMPLERLKADEPWFESHELSYSPTWLSQTLSASGNLVHVRRIGMPSLSAQEHYLYLEIDPKAVFQPIYGLTLEPYAVLVENGEESFFLADTLSVQREYTAEAILQGRDTGLNVVHAPLPAIGWEMYFISDTDEAANAAGFWSYVAPWAMILLLGVLVIVCITSITGPIEDLAFRMRAFGRGNMSLPLPEPGRTDEIGTLIQSFNDMATHIRELIEVTYASEIKEKEYRQRLLRAQINPHFLYNSLSIIHAKAVMARQPEISAMATALAKFYRSALNGGRDTTAIRGEVENIRAYVQIQKMLSSNDFEAEYAIDESVLDEKIPNFILQPFVENAIDHGLAASEREGKRLRISVRREEGDAVFEICDNGAGMDEATLNSLFAEKATGYGIRNVDDRLRLAYGNGYSLNIQSVPGRGTRVRLRLALET